MHLGMVNKNKTDVISEILNFAKEYSTVNPDRILLGSNSIPKELKKDVALQVEVNKKLSYKIPSWSDFCVYIPEKINLEQASSELTAKYKTKYIKENDVIVDLTSGLGVDLFFMSCKAKLGVYIDQNINLSESVKYNFEKLLGHDLCNRKFAFISDDYSIIIEDVIKKYSPNIVYIDPARRSIDNNEKRLYSIEDCQPNILSVIPMLNELYQKQNKNIDRYIIKISPMFDINELINKVNNIENIDIISVKGEVKEILLNISKDLVYKTLISSVNILSEDNTIEYSSYWDREKELDNSELSEPLKYIYELNSPTLKSGLYKSIALDFGLKLLSNESKLYTSNEFVNRFPGKIMILEECVLFNKSNLKNIKRKYTDAQVRTRNFPMTPDALRAKLSLSESESIRIIGTKDKEGNNILLICKLL